MLGSGRVNRKLCAVWVVLRTEIVSLECQLRASCPPHQARVWLRPPCVSSPVGASALGPIFPNALITIVPCAIVSVAGFPNRSPPEVTPITAHLQTVIIGSRHLADLSLGRQGGLSLPNARLGGAGEKR